MRLGSGVLTASRHGRERLAAVAGFQPALEGGSGMADAGPQEWLADWVEKNLRSPGYVQRKASMHDEAEACAQQAVAAGISIADLKTASGGDLEKYLVDRQNEFTDGQKTA